jgi:AcrR family transcriptional regulator
MAITPPRGREAEARTNDRAVVDAARLVFAVHGADAPVSAVAAAAGVGIGSLYRRYPTKEALLGHLCLESMRQVEAAAEQALDESDAWEGLAGFIRDCVSFRAGAFGATIAGSVEPTDEMRLVARRGHQLMTQLLVRAQDDGSARQDVTAVDVQLLIELFSRRSPDDSSYERLLAVALDGLSATGPTTELPVAPLSWRSYLSRWRPSVVPHQH